MIVRRRSHEEIVPGYHEYGWRDRTPDGRFCKFWYDWRTMIPNQPGITYQQYSRKLGRLVIIPNLKQ